MCHSYTFCGANCSDWQFLLIKAAILLYFSILFIQSGVDKLKTRDETLTWFKSFFNSSFLKGQESVLLSVLTLLELCSGFCSLIGIPMLIMGHSLLGFIGVATGALALLSVFFGQRIAKDYASAAATTGYLVFAIIALLVFTLL